MSPTLRVGFSFVLVLATGHGHVTSDPAERAVDDLVERQIEGWTVVVDPRLLEDEIGPAALTALANHLQRVRYILDPEKVSELQELRLWIDLENPRLRNMQYHPNVNWLTARRHDPRLVKHVHVPRAAALLDRSMWAKHPYVLLHELAHAYHDQVLGFDQEDVIAAFREAEEKEIYESVLDHRGRKVRHYALSNHKEYFAESSEAYLGVNDFYPFVRAELREHDPRMFQLMERFWGAIR